VVFSFLLQSIVIKQVPYQKDAVANSQYAVELFVSIFHNMQLHIINFLPIIPLYGVAWCSIQNKEGQNTDLPLPVHSYITVYTGR